MTTLFAQPYDICATGFYFETAGQYEEKAKNLTNDYGDIVEEFEIQFIDGESIDCKLFSALNIHQGNFADFLDCVDAWDIDEKITVILAVGECGYSFTFGQDTPDQFDLDLYEMDSLRDLAMEFVEQGIFGDIPANIQNYLDYNAIAYDLGMDYSETIIDGTLYIYRMA